MLYRMDYGGWNLVGRLSMKNSTLDQLGQWHFLQFCCYSTRFSVFYNDCICGSSFRILVMLA